MTRSRSRWKAVRSGCSGSATRRPRLSRERIAYGASVRASISSSSCLVRNITFNSRDATTPPTALEALGATSLNMCSLTREAGGFIIACGG